MRSRRLTVAGFAVIMPHVTCFVPHESEGDKQLLTAREANCNRKGVQIPAADRLLVSKLGAAFAPMLGDGPVAQFRAGVIGHPLNALKYAKRHK